MVIGPHRKVVFFPLAVQFTDPELEMLSVPATCNVEAKLDHLRFKGVPFIRCHSLYPVTCD